jgi:hypothetical protein
MFSEPASYLERASERIHQLETTLFEAALALKPHWGDIVSRTIEVDGRSTSAS